MTKGPELITFYLPQYHVIPENNDWWGEGFTEWSRVRNAWPLFENHHQPRTPLQYYDLSDVEVMKEQANVAKKFGIYGFCYYHYWFAGKKLLEKPLEQMLATKDVNMPFCLCWANEKWTRAWEGKSKEILIDQHYGGEDEWNDHVNYLIPFFNDPRYIRIKGRPVFLIYRTESYRYFDRMIDFWNSKMKERGLNELYIAEMLTSFQKMPVCLKSDAVVEFEPMFTIGSSKSLRSKIRNYTRKRLSFLFRRSYRVFDYDRVWKRIARRKKKYGKKDIFLGAFTDWDNTPRFLDKASVFKNVTVKKFQYYLKKQADKSTSEFLFINAWNEWSEGAYLEPDTKNGYDFLESVKNISDGYSC